MMHCFDNVKKNININIFGDVPQNAKHRAHNESNDNNRPPLFTPTPIDNVTLNLNRRVHGLTMHLYNMHVYGLAMD